MGLDAESYRARNFVVPPPEPRFPSARLGGSAVYVERYEEAIAFYTEVFGPPVYVEDGHTHGWRLGGTWLTVFPSDTGGPRNAELHVYLDTVAEAERLHRAIEAAGGTVEEPVDALMFEAVRFCQAWDPSGTPIVVLAPLGGRTG